MLLNLQSREMYYYYQCVIDTILDWFFELVILTHFPFQCEKVPFASNNFLNKSNISMIGTKIIFLGSYLASKKDTLSQEEISYVTIKRARVLTYMYVLGMLAITLLRN